MVEKLAEAGHEVVVHARRPEVRDRLKELGIARTTDDLAEVARDADAVIVCVFSDEQLEDACGPLVTSMRPGAVLASHVTGTIQTIRGIETEAGKRGVHVVDSPLSGDVNDIRAGRLTVILGGQPTARSTVEQIMAAYADPIIHSGELGSALAIKLANNFLLAANAQVLAEAVRLVEQLGSSESDFLATLMTASGGSKASKIAMERGGSMEAFYATTIEFLRKDVSACLKQARELGVEPRMLTDVIHNGPLKFA
jgi:3-hydroxyisobutyrate dehydrogenase-like beta-hydroxyacid dehydrogenase